MKIRTALLTLPLAAVLLTAGSSPSQAQSPGHPVTTPLAASATTSVPALIPYSDVAVSAAGKPLTGDLSITFLIYKDESGGEPLFSETQSVSPDAVGAYKVQLGASRSHGLPAELFSTGEARWLEVQVAGERPQPRVLLASVPYAFKAADAATLGGLPASAFALAGSQSTTNLPVSASGVAPNATTNVTTTGGTLGYLPRFSATSAVVNSSVFDTGTNVGIGTANPAATLDVKGASVLRGSVNVARNGNATATAGVSSFPLILSAQTYSSATKTAVNPSFQLMAEPVNSNTASPSARFSLLFNPGHSVAETGFYFNPNGTIHFAPNQTFPGGTGTGTITGVTAGTGLTGGGTSGSVTLKVDTNKVPLLVANNTYTGAETVNGSQTINGNALVSGTTTMEGVVGIGTGASGSYQLFVSASGKDALYATGATDSNGIGRSGMTGQGGAGETNTNIAGTGVRAFGGFGFGTTKGGEGIYARAGDSDSGDYPPAAYFDGYVQVNGTLFASSKSFKIDHPVDPANKYLVHASVESSEMMNIYTGNITTGDSGTATVKLPDWFEAENGDFRYQLTSIGRDAHVWVSAKVHNGSFEISTNVPRVEVSWQITAVRQDAYAKAHPMVVEEAKPERERGFYTHPELYGQPEEKQTEWARQPQMMKQIKAQRGAAKSVPHP